MVVVVPAVDVVHPDLTVVDAVVGSDVVDAVHSAASYCCCGSVVVVVLWLLL